MYYSLDKLTTKEYEEMLDWLCVMRGQLKTKEQKLTHLTYFLRYCVETQDEHDPDDPFKSFPFDRKPYLLNLAKEWIYNPMLIIAKSRQMMVTWLYCACWLWDTMFLNGRLNMVVSKKEEDADKLLTRIKGIYKRLPPKMRAYIPTKPTTSGDIGSFCKLEFDNWDSKIIGLSQNPEAIRQNTTSNLLIDEAAFIPESRDAFIAMKPSIDGGGHCVIVSTPKGKEFFYRMYSDREGVDPDTKRPQTVTKNGIQIRDNRNGFIAIRLHYSASKERDPAWAKKHKRGMPTDGWEQDYEINFMKAGGRAMYPDFIYDIHAKPLQPVNYKPIQCGIDFGYHHPALVVTQITDKDQLAILDEWMPKDITIENFGKLALFMLKKKFPWHFQNRHKMVEWFCDPAGTQRNDKSELTSIQILQKKYKIFCRFKRVGITQGVRIIQQLLMRRSDMTPGLLIDPKCSILIEGFQGGYEEQKHKEGHAPKELPHDDEYYSHLQDALRYIVVHKFPKFMRPYNPNQQTNDNWNPFEEEPETEPETITGYVR